MLLRTIMTPIDIELMGMTGEQWHTVMARCRGALGYHGWVKVWKEGGGVDPSAAEMVEAGLWKVCQSIDAEKLAL